MSSSLASAFARRGRGSKAAHPAALASLLTTSTGSHGPLQTRGYGFGRLSSYFIHYISSDVYTRGKPPAYNKYCENLYRRGPCDPHSLAKDVANDVKRVVNNVVNNYLHPHPEASQRPGRDRSTDGSPRRTPDNPQGLRPGQNIEDAERAPLEHFLFGDKKTRNTQKQPLSREPLVSSTQPTEDADYVIDPVSNRKVPRKQFESGDHFSDQDVEIPVKPFEPYKPQFEAFWAPKTEDTKTSGDVSESGGGVGGHPPGNGADHPMPESSVVWRELGRYRAFMSHEPDGKYAEQQKTEAPDPEELEAYRKPFFAHEPDGIYATSQGWPGYSLDELAKYRNPFFCYEPDGLYAASYTQPQRDQPELARYGAFRSHEPDGMYAASYTQSQCDQPELSRYEAVRSHEPDGKYADASTQPQCSEPELSQYEAVRSHEPDGMYAAEAAAASAQQAEDAANHEAFGYDETETKRLAEERQEKEVCADSEGSRDRLMAQVAAESPSAVGAQPSREGSTPTTAQRPLTGNYVQDFPEDFSKSWTREITANSASSQLSPEQEQTVSDEPLQPTLDRLTTATSTPANQTSEANLSTLYKILAYDPATQSIHTAETTSSVAAEENNATPLTPAEVLLRISHPAKFLPHFAPLQAQGFEIVSGSGDVLIFRKMREGEEAATNGNGRPSAVNPIDMTGEPRADGYSVKALRFSSPTGFVNYYDLPLPAEARTGGRHKVWEAEQQKDGETVDGKESTKKRTSLPRKVALGTASLAGAVYSIGVVSEYFRSGGVDGKGPKGF
ncbi:hypothetical protein VTJ49DRAFT_2751 [Mycothermus thermophilus]|uniref:Uncharacterized protein n=1 Tax=Humicola insolens TaxID=85995 RepID=A0ABR3VN23_HUMIN